MKRFLQLATGAAIAALFVSACAADPDRLPTSGYEASPPAGWGDYCRRVAADPACPVEKRT